MRPSSMGDNAVCEAVNALIVSHDQAGAVWLNRERAQQLHNGLTRAGIKGRRRLITDD